MNTSSQSWKSRWLAYITQRTNELATERQKLFTATGAGVSLWRLTKLIMAEVWLGVLSLPIYLVFSPQEAVEDVERYPEKVFAYRLRRLFTLGALLLIVVYFASAWIFKVFFLNPLKNPSDQITYTWSFANPTALLSFNFDPALIQLRGGVAGLITSSPISLPTTSRCSAVLEAREPFRFKPTDMLIGFSTIATVRSGAVGLQLSSDGGENWYVWNRTAWGKVVPATANTYSSPDDVSAHIVSLPRPVNQETTLLFRAKLANDCFSATELSSISVQSKLASVPRDAALPELTSTDIPISTNASLPAALLSFKASSSVPPPYHLTLTYTVPERSITVTGRALAHAEVAVFVDNPAIAIYRTSADENGRWQVIHDQAYLRLSEGEHTFYAVTRDPVSPFISEPSEGIVFEVYDHQLPTIFTVFDTKSTLLTLLALCVATGLMTYRQRTS